MRRCLSLGVVLLLAAAESAADQSAHVHGQATLNLVAEANSVMLRLESPAMNMLGFEHEPATKAQHKALEAVLKKLHQPEALIAFNGTTCRFTTVDITNPFSSYSEHDKHDKHDKHEHHADSGDEHREFVVEYQAECPNLSALKSIHFSLLDQFKGIEKLDVAYIIGGQQGAAELNRSSSKLIWPNE